MKNIDSLLAEYVPQSDSQLKMRERLIKSREKVDQLHYEEWCQLMDFTILFARLGLRMMISEACEVEMPRFEIDKIKLELDYKRFKYPTVEDADKITGRITEICDFLDKHRDKLYKIQSHHQVSGLEIVEYNFGEKVIYAPGHSEDAVLPLIESDLDILNEWKDPLANAWKSGLEGYQIYRWDNEEKHGHPCKPCSMAEFNAYLATCKWVNPWMRDGFPSIDMGRTTDMNGWSTTQSFTAIPVDMAVTAIHL